MTPDKTMRSLTFQVIFQVFLPVTWPCNLFWGGRITTSKCDFFSYILILGIICF